MAIRRQRIKQLVRGLLQKYNPSEALPVDVEQIIRLMGLQVLISAAPTNEISGFIGRQGRTAVIGVNEAHPPHRQRFTLAHELGHFLLHVQGATQMHVDRLEVSPFAIRFRNELSSEGTNNEEREANYFAAELLMPEHFIEREIELLRENELLHDPDKKVEDLVSDLAREFDVSQQAMTFRLANLGYIVV